MRRGQRHVAKLTASDDVRSSRSDLCMRRSNQSRYALCVKNHGHAAALEVRKLYRVIADQVAANRGLLRVVDESGQDYLYPAGYFLSIELPRAAIRMLARTA